MMMMEIFFVTVDMEDWSDFASSGSEFDISQAVVSSLDSENTSHSTKKSRKKLKRKGAPKKTCKKRQPKKSVLPALYQDPPSQESCTHGNNIYCPQEINSDLQVRSSSPQPSCSYHVSENQRTDNQTPKSSSEAIGRKEDEKVEQKKVGKKKKAKTRHVEKEHKKETLF